MTKRCAKALAFTISLFSSFARGEALVTIKVAADAKGTPISDLVYGANDLFFVPNDTELSFPIIRWGGNNTTRYNWQANAWNAGADWYFLNIPADYKPGPKGVQYSYTDRLLLKQLSKGQLLLLTAPTIGWVTKDRKPGWGYSLKKYGKQQATESSQSGGDAGNGLSPAGAFILDGNPKDTSVPAGPNFIADWVTHNRQIIKSKGKNDVIYYALDNEPMLWHRTHQDIRYGDKTLKSPELGYDELWERTVSYATAIKKADPKAKILGPSVWGWCDYFTSAKDECKSGPDRAAHGGKALLPWYLKKVCEYQKNTGLRLVDYLDVHYYAADEQSSTDESGPAQVRRLAGTRALFERNYKDGSWITEPIELVPRLKQWIKEECPGTGLAITEYRFGDNAQGLSAMLSNAEAVAIFGREGADIATYWGGLPKDSLLEKAFQLYLNYDGQGSSALGGLSLPVVSSEPLLMPSYAIKTKDHLLVYVFNKTAKKRLVRLSGISPQKGARRFFAGEGMKKISEAHEGPGNIEVPPMSAMLLEL